jgi:hypothetical protein
VIYLLDSYKVNVYLYNIKIHKVVYCLYLLNAMLIQMYISKYEFLDRSL